MGSMHLGRGPMALGPVLQGAFDRSDLLVMEIDQEALGLIETLRLTATYARLPEGESLSQHLSAEAWAALLHWCERRGESVSQFEPFQAWFGALVVELKEYELLGYRAAYGSEEQFTRRAKQQGKRIEALETAQEQMQMLSSSSPEAQERMLLEALETDGSAFAELLRVYDAGDAEGMNDILMRSQAEPGGPELLERVVFARNEVMVTRLQERSSDGLDRFVLVGASHLVGERGIPNLLRARGFDVQRVGAP